MSTIQYLQLSVLGTLLLLLSFSSCNVSKEQDNETKTSNQLAINGASEEEVKAEDRAIGYARFKDMSVEERWDVLSPSRRNQLRERPDLYPYFKPMIAKYPDKEEMSAREGEASTAEDSPVNPYAQYKFETFKAEKNVDQRWDAFSEKRKAYMKAHPDKYPEFKKYLNK